MLTKNQVMIHFVSPIKPYQENHSDCTMESELEGLMKENPLRGD